MDRTTLFDLIKFSTIIQIIVNWFNTTKDPINVTMILAEFEQELGKILHKKDRIYARQLAQRKLDHLVRNGFLHMQSNRSPKPNDYTMTEDAIEIILNSTPENCVSVLTKKFGGPEMPVGTPKNTKKFASRKVREPRVSSRAASITYDLPGGGTVTGTPAEIVTLIRELGLANHSQTAAAGPTDATKLATPATPVWNLHQTTCELVSALAGRLKTSLQNLRDYKNKKYALSIRNVALGLSKFDKLVDSIKYELSCTFVEATGEKSCNMPNSSSVPIPAENLSKIIGFLDAVSIAAEEAAHKNGPLVLPLLRPPVDETAKKRTYFPCSFKSSDDVQWKYVGRSVELPTDEEAELVEEAE